MKQVILELAVAAMATYGFWCFLTSVKQGCRYLATRFRTSGGAFDKKRK